MNDVSSILKSIRPESDFSASPDFIKDGLLDSFDVVALVAAMEKAFCITIAGTEIIPENFKNLPAIGALLKKCGAQL